MSTDTSTPVSDTHDDLATFDVDVTQYQENAAGSDPNKLAADMDALTSELGVGNTPPTETASAAKKVEDQPDPVVALREQVRQAGYSDEDVQSLSADALSGLLEVQNQLALQPGWQAPQFAAPPIQQPAGMFPMPQAPAMPAAQGYGQPPQVQSPPQVKVEFDPNAFEQPFVDKMNDLQRQTNENLASLHRQNMELQQTIMRQQQFAQQQAIAQQQAQMVARDEAESRQLDQWITQKGDAFKPLLGGEKPSDAQVRVRQALFQEHRRLAMQAAATGVQVDPAFLRETAAKNVLGNQYSFFQQQAQRQPIEQRQRQIVGRANGVQPKTKVSGTEQAAQRLDDFFKSRGLT